MARRTLALFLVTLFAILILTSSAADGTPSVGTIAVAETGESIPFLCSGNTEDFTQLVGNNWRDIIYLKLNSTIRIAQRNQPDMVEIEDRMLREDGTAKYTELAVQKLDYRWENGEIRFVLPFSPSAMLSSNSRDYDPGRSIRGIRVTCAWKYKTLSYVFVVRTDATEEPLFR